MAGHDQFLDVLLHLMRDLRRSYDRQAQAVGLTRSRARALTMLARHEGATQAELAALLDIEPPTLKRQIDALVADGFVERRPLEGDARKSALFLTARGHDNAIVEFTHRLRRELLEDIPDGDLRAAAAVLDRLARNVSRLDRT